MMYQRQKDTIVEECLLTVTRAVRRINLTVPQGSQEPRMFCHLCALAVVQELKRHGVDAMFQAGSAGWRMVPSEQDDGVSPTWYWHRFEEMRAEFFALAHIFPEIHCWAVIPGDDPEFIDLTTAVLPQKVQLQGFTWKEEQPPSYLWLPLSQMPDTSSYQADLKAIHITLGFVRKHLMGVFQDSK